MGHRNGLNTDFRISQGNFYLVGLTRTGTSDDPPALSLLLGSVQHRVWADGLPRSFFQAYAVTLWVLPLFAELAFHENPVFSRSDHL